jgi:LytS/YehU family sensor histidine kinase
MDATIFSFLLVQLQLICVIVVSGFLIQSKFSIDVHDRYHALKTQFLIIFVLCNLSIYGMVSGKKKTGALVNVRDFEMGFVRFIREFFVRQGIGLIGTVYHRIPGGVGVTPCFLNTILTTGSGRFIWPGYIQNFCGVCLPSDDIKRMLIGVK